MDIRNRDALIGFLENGKRAKFVFFWGHTESGTGPSKACLSQWYEAPFTAGGLRYPTAEHYMMAEKARLFGDHAIAERIVAARTPGEAKHLGRKVADFDEGEWQRRRFDIVVAGNIAKFSAHEKLKQFLLGTGERVLVEASPVDRIWGIGLAANVPAAEDPRRWRGLNLLGFALMEVRSRLAEA